MTGANYSLGASSLLVTLAALLFLCGVARAWSECGLGRGISWGRAVAGLLGLISLAIALSPPLEALSTLFFSAHMAQHLLLVLVAAPMLVAGVPLLAMLWLVHPTTRRRSITAVRGSPVMGRIWSTLSHPLVAWTSFVLLLWLWHLPGAYQAALSSEPLHLLEHLSLTGGAVLFWWVVLQPLGRRRLDRLAAPLFLFLAAIQGGVLGAMITLSPEAWYRHYERIAVAQGYSALADQRLAGLLMWIPPSGVYLGVASWLLYRSLARAQARQAGTQRRPLAHLNSLLPIGAAALLVSRIGQLTSLY